MVSRSIIAVKTYWPKQCLIVKPQRISHSVRQPLSIETSARNSLDMVRLGSSRGTCHDSMMCNVHLVSRTIYIGKVYEVMND